MQNTDLERRLSIVERKAHIDKVNEEERQRVLKNDTQQAIISIKALEPRISALIEIANKCIEEGIEFPSATETEKFGYGKGYNSYDFFADGINHHVGFMNGKRGFWYTGESKYNKIEYLGIDEGGFCGVWDFYTNGKEIFLKHESEHTVKDAELKYIKDFLKEFDEFETAFYKWIDSIGLSIEQSELTLDEKSLSPSEERYSAAVTLATEIDEFILEYDPYEYADRVDDRLREVEGDIEMLLDGNYRSFETTFQQIIENEDKEDPFENIKKAKELLSKIKDFDVKCNNRRGLGYELYNATKNGNINKVQDLINEGADVNYVFRPNEYGNTPLHIAAYFAEDEIIELLIKSGADVNSSAITGKTPLTYAKERHNRKHTIDLLIQYGAGDGGIVYNDTIPKFMEYLKNEFPGCLDNHFTYDLVKNLVSYAYQTHGHSKGSARDFICDILPEVDPMELQQYLPDFITEPLKENGTINNENEGYMRKRGR